MNNTPWYRSTRLHVYGLLTALLLPSAYMVHLYSVSPVQLERWLFPAKALWLQQQVHCSGPQPLEYALKHSIRKLHIPAGQVAVLEGGQLSACYVQAKTVAGKAADENTRFRFASVTKPILAATFYHWLATQQEVSEQTRLFDVLPLPPLEAGASSKDARIFDITLGQLLAHQSGLQESNPRHGMFIYKQSSWCPNSLAHLHNIRLEYAPGTQTSYANGNYCLLALALEQLSGEHWYALAQQYFELQRYGVELIPTDGYADDEIAYSFMNEEFYSDTYYRDLDLTSGLPALGLSGSAIGLVRLFSEQILTDPNITTKLLRWQENSDCNDCYMHGLAGLTAANGQRVFYHSGKLHGASALLLIQPQVDEFRVMAWLGNGSPKVSQKNGLLKELSGG